eukprot:272591-Hanusia_phi.AAC.1
MAVTVQQGGDAFQAGPALRGGLAGEDGKVLAEVAGAGAVQVEVRATSVQPRAAAVDGQVRGLGDMGGTTTDRGVRKGRWGETRSRSMAA